MKQALLLLLFSIVLSAKGQITFQNTYVSPSYQYSGNSYEYNVANSVIQASDSGFIFIGSLEDSFSEKVLLIKTNANGDTLWTTTYGGIGYDYGNSIQQTFDGGYIITGFSGFNTYLIKTNGNGGTLWTNTYGISNGDVGNTIVRQTSDSGYIIGCSTDILGSGEYNNFILIKTNKNGDTLWSKCYGTYNSVFGPDNGPNDNVLEDMQRTKDGGYIMAGIRFLYTNFDQAALIIKVDSVGNPMWSYIYGNDSDQLAYHAAYSIQQTMDGGYIVEDQNPGAFGDFFKIDSNGAVLWIKYNTDGPNGPVIQTKDGGYALPGYGTLTKTDSIGDIQWIKAYSDTLVFHSIAQTNDGGFILAGVQSDYNGFSNQSILIKTDANGNSTCNVAPPYNLTVNEVLQILDSVIIVTSVSPLLMDSPIVVGNAPLPITSCLPLAVNEISNENSIALYPNPATNQLTIHTSSFHNEEVTVSVMNVLGQVMQEEKASPQPSPKEREFTINIKNLSAGIYFLEMQNETGRWVGRFVKE